MAKPQPEYVGRPLTWRDVVLYLAREVKVLRNKVDALEYKVDDLEHCLAVDRKIGEQPEMGTEVSESYTEIQSSANTCRCHMKRRLTKTAKAGESPSKRRRKPTRWSAQWSEAVSVARGQLRIKGQERMLKSLLMEARSIFDGWKAQERMLFGED